MLDKSRNLLQERLLKYSEENSNLFNDGWHRSVVEIRKDALATLKEKGLPNNKNEIQLKGYVGISILGKSVKWTKVKKPH